MNSRIRRKTMTILLKATLPHSTCFAYWSRIMELDNMAGADNEKAASMYGTGATGTRNPGGASNNGSMT